MSDPLSSASIAVAALSAVIVVAVAGLKAWREWIALQKLGLERDAPRPAAGGTARIEIADLRERVRKLEAIAAGVDL